MFYFKATGYGILQGASNQEQQMKTRFQTNILLLDQSATEFLRKDTTGQFKYEYKSPN